MSQLIAESLQHLCSRRAELLLDLVAGRAADSNSIRSHTSARRSLRNTDQWSATLAPMVRHTLWLDLASRLPEGMVILPGESKPATMQSIDVVVGDLSSTRAGS